MVIWITGRKGSGKSTLASLLAGQFRSAVVLDGDTIRDTITGNHDFSDAGRMANIETLANLAHVLESQGLTVIVACISPRRAWRKAVREIFLQSMLVYLPGGTLWEGSEYEEPDAEELRPILSNMLWQPGRRISWGE